MRLNKKVCLWLAASLAINVLTYNGTRLLTSNWYHYDMTTAIEQSIPFVPWTITVYLGCYLFWICNYAMGCFQEEKKAVRFLASECFAKFICCLCFIIIPTTNVRPQVIGEDVFSRAMRWLYCTDAADNLFPSIHCLTSWFCVIAVRNQKTISSWYKYLSVVLARAVCVSTLTTKQHVLPDVVVGVLLAEICYRLIPFIYPFSRLF